MDFWNAAFLFFGGALAHLWGQRIMDKGRAFRIYRETFLKSFIVLKYTVETCESLISGIDDKDVEKEGIKAAFQFWKRMAIQSLQECIPSPVWKSLKAKDWDSTVKALERVTKTGSNNEL